MKKISIMILVFVLIFLLTGCEEEKKVVSNGKKINTANMEHKHCTRSGTGSSGVTTELNHELYYTGDKLNIIESTPLYST